MPELHHVVMVSESLKLRKTKFIAGVIPIVGPGTVACLYARNLRRCIRRGDRQATACLGPFGCSGSTIEYPGACFTTHQSSRPEQLVSWSASRLATCMFCQVLRTPLRDAAPRGLMSSSVSRLAMCQAGIRHNAIGVWSRQYGVLRLSRPSPPQRQLVARISHLVTMGCISSGIAAKITSVLWCNH